MKKQKYTVRELNILTSDNKAKMNYLQHVRMNHFDSVTFQYLCDSSQESHKALT